MSAIKVKKKKKKSKKSNIENIVNGNSKEELEIFPGFTISCKDPKTAISLLGSPDDEIILKAFNHIDQYAGKQIENTENLKNLGIVQIILSEKFYEHEKLFIKRFALKLLASVFEIKNKNFNEEIMTEIFHIAKNHYENDDDNFVIEYCSAILIEILDEPRLCVTFENDSDFITNGIYKHLANTNDPDILYNSYRLLLKIIHCALSILKICNIETILFQRILDDVSNKLMEIRLISLEIFYELIACQNEFTKLQFSSELFFDKIFAVLENDEFIDSHEMICKIFQRLMGIENYAKFFQMKGYLHKFVTYMKNKGISERLKSIGVLVEISNYSYSLDTLYDLGFLDFLLESINDKENINLDVIVGINRMLAHSNAFLKIVDDDNTISHLITVIADGIQSFKIREIAASTLQILCRKNKTVCQKALKNEINSIISDYLNQDFGEISKDFLIQLVNILIAMANYEEIRTKTMNQKLAKTLYNAIKNSSRFTILRVNLINSATAYAFETTLQNEFLKFEDFHRIILQALKSSATIMKIAICGFLFVTGRMKQFSDRYIEDGILEYLIEDQVSLSICPSWSQAIETILSTNPSLKFAIRGRLEIQDLIDNGFIISKYHWKDFRILKKIMKDDICPLYPIIMVNFNHSICSPESVLHIQTDSVNWTICLKPVDEYLPRYLKDLRNILETKGLLEKPKNSKLIDVAQLEQKLKILGEFVAHSMCGGVAFEWQQEQKGVLNESAVRTHLNMLKCELHSNVIPLGRIRYGGHFERAVLFKALADQIGLLCTLVRSVDGRVLYNEIPVPTSDDRKKLMATHIVDLIEHPGEIYSSQSRLAYRYLQLLG